MPLLPTPPICINNTNATVNAVRAQCCAPRPAPRRPGRRATARACTLPPDEASAARAERRAAKAVVKEAARERRTTKTPKHVKKRATKGKKKKK